MKFNLSGFLDAAAAVHAGDAAGRAQGLDVRRAREQQDFNQRLQLFQLAGRLYEQQQRQRQANAAGLSNLYMGAARIDGIDPAARESLFNRGMSLAEQMAQYGDDPGPYGPDALQSLLQSDPYGRQIGANLPGGAVPNFPFGPLLRGPLGAPEAPPVEPQAPPPAIQAANGAVIPAAAGQPPQPDEMQLYKGARPISEGMPQSPAAPAPGRRGAGLFQSPAFPTIRGQIVEAANLARTQGMNKEYQELSRLLVDLDGRKVGAEDAWARFQQIGPVMSQQPQRQWATTAATRLQTDIQQGTIKPEALPAARQLLGVLEQFSGGNAIDPAALAQARQQYTLFLSDPAHYQPSAQQRLQENVAALREDQDLTRRQNSAQAQNSRYLDDIQAAAKSGNLARFQELVAQQRAFAASQPAEFNLRPFGGDDLDPSQRRTVTRQAPIVQEALQRAAGQVGGLPSLGIAAAGYGFPLQTVETPETEEEARARVLAAARGYVVDPAAKQKLTRAALGDLLKVFQGKRWEQMDAPERASILERIGEFSDELGLPRVLPPGIRADRLTPYEQKIVQDREERRAETRRHNSEMESIRRTVASKTERGELSDVQRQEASLMADELDELQREASELRRMNRDDRTEADRARLDELTKPGGLIEQQRQAIKNYLRGGEQGAGAGTGQARQSAAASSGGWNPALKDQRLKVLQMFRKDQKREPNAQEARNLYYLIETGQIRL